MTLQTRRGFTASSHGKMGLSELTDWDCLLLFADQGRPARH